MVQAYSIYETKTHLSEILRFVKSGQEAVINDRGHPVARILPFKPLNEFEDRWRWLCESGRVIGADAAVSQIAPKHQSKGALQRFLAERE